MIFVTSYWQLEDDFAFLQPDWLISILGPGDRLKWPEMGMGSRRLQIECDDIQYPTSGLIAPTIEHVEVLVAFLGRWNGQGDLLIHCKAGTSRSPAAALIALSVLNPGMEEQAALMLRRKAPQAKPSQIFLHHADDILKNNGALAEAALKMPMPDRISETDLVILPQSLRTRV